MTNAISEVLVTIRFFDDSAVQQLESRGHRVVRADVAYDALDTAITPGIEKALETAQAWILGAAPVTRELLERFPNLKVVARRGVGYDSVDVDAVKELGRILTNTPGGNEPAVADHALALMLAVGKRIREAHSRMQAGDWRALVGSELHGKTVGLIGFGRIGRLVAKRLSGFESQVIVYDPFLSEQVAADAGVKTCELDELLQHSDVVSLHVPLTQGTRNIIDAKALSKMKPSAVLVNTSRGELIDEAALLEALCSGKLAGAGLDVFVGEHDQSKRALAEQLLALPNVVGTPHTAASTKESLHRANLTAAECVAAVLEGRSVAKQCVVVDGRSHL